MTEFRCFCSTCFGKWHCFRVTPPPACVYCGSKDISAHPAPVGGKL